MENGDKVVITPQDVIVKLKDDGDFDRLRLQIIQKLKDNEELRNSIATVVKQSSVLNRAGAENMKPRQLSDAIRDEVGDRLMSQLSVKVGEIIRDEDGMRKEIKSTIKGVYSRMLNPEYKEEGVSVSAPPHNEAVNGSITDSVNGVDETMLDNDVSEPPGFSLCAENDAEESQKRTQMALPQGRIIPEELKNEKLVDSRDAANHNGQVVPLVPQPRGTELTRSGDCSDEDPDLPPGFG